MLRELEIRDLALLARARLSFEGGLVALTGATGVGKSLVLQALGLLAGARAAADQVRTGASHALVRGLFEVGDDLRPVIEEALGVALPDEGELVLERRLEAGGGSRATANGSPVTVAALRAAAPALVEIHGQSEHQRLLDPVEQARLLDRFGALAAERAAWATALAAAREARRRREAAGQDRRERRGRIADLEHRVEVIRGAELDPGERERLRDELRRFDRSEQYLADLHAVAEGLLDADGSATDTVGAARRALASAAALDPELEPLLEDLDAALDRLDVVAREATRRSDDATFDPERRAEVEERLDALDRVLRAWGPSEDDALTALAEAAAELDRLRAAEADDADARPREERALAALRGAGAKLVAGRRTAADRLAAGVREELADLALGAARFEVVVDAPAKDADPLDGATEEGPAPVRVRFSANPGEPLRDLARTASGGELARVSLALKARLAAADRTPTLVFDEIDAEVGGRLGPAVAARLRAVAEGRQVLVVTHLPSIAAAADLHLHVRKEVADGRTTAAVERLEGAQREQELAEMLRGEGQAEGGLEVARALLAEGAARPARRGVGRKR